MYETSKKLFIIKSISETLIFNFFIKNVEKLLEHWSKLNHKEILNLVKNILYMNTFTFIGITFFYLISSK